MSWKLYGVKTVYRTDALGNTNIVIPDDVNDATLVEERIVLIKARSHDEAIRKAEAEAEVYTKETYRNVYEQTVRCRYLGACEAFELYEEPSPGVEVFSATEVISRSVSDEDVVNQYLGQPETDPIDAQRLKFLNLEFNQATNAELKFHAKK